MYRCLCADPMPISQHEPTAGCLCPCDGRAQPLSGPMFGRETPAVVGDSHEQIWAFRGEFHPANGGNCMPDHVGNELDDDQVGGLFDVGIQGRQRLSRSDFDRQASWLGQLVRALLDRRDQAEFG